MCVITMEMVWVIPFCDGTWGTFCDLVAVEPWQPFFPTGYLLVVKQGNSPSGYIMLYLLWWYSRFNVHLSWISQLAMLDDTLSGINFGSLVWSCDFESSSSVLLLVRSENFSSSMATYNMNMLCVQSSWFLSSATTLTMKRYEKYSGNNSYVPNKLVSANLSLSLSLW